MSILFAGDTHGNSRHMAYLFEKAVAHDCATIFQVGDFGYWPHTDRGKMFLCSVDAHIQDTGVQVYFIDGNHDNHDALAAMPVSDDGLRYLTVDGGLVHIPRGMDVYIDDLLVMGYGGAFSIDYKSRVVGESYWPAEMIDNEHCLMAGHLMRGVRPDILATHDAPAGFDLGNGWKAEFHQTNHNRSCLRTLMLTVQAQRVICGHWHERKTAEVDRTRIDVLDCDNARDRRDSFMIVDGSNDRNGNPVEAEVSDWQELQRPVIDCAGQPVTPKAPVAVGQGADGRT